MGTIGRLKQGDLYIAGEIREGLPPNSNGLMGYFPLDGHANTKYYSPAGLRILNVSHGDNVNGHNATSWFRSNGAIITHETYAQWEAHGVGEFEGVYDLILFDYHVWAFPIDPVNLLSMLEVDGVSIVALGNDTRTNHFVKTYTATGQAAHNMVIDELAPISGPTNIYGGGSTDVIGGIAELQNGAIPMYRREDLGHITGYYYQAKNGAIFYFDQEGNGATEPFKKAALWAANNTRSRIEHSNANFLQDCVSIDKTTTNLFTNGLLSNSASSWGMTGTTVTNFGNFTRLTTSGAAYDGISQSVNMTLNKVYTFSYWVRHVSGTAKIGGHVTNGGSAKIRIDGGSWVASTVIDIPDDGKWHFLEQQFTASATGSAAHWIQPGRTVTGVVIVDIRTGDGYGVQIEDSAFSTSFIDGTRSNSVFKINVPSINSKGTWTLSFEYKHTDLTAHPANIVFATSRTETISAPWFGLNVGTNTFNTLGGTSIPHQWNTVTFVYNGANTLFYLNGVYVSTYTGKLFFTTDYLAFGAMPGYGSTYQASLFVKNVYVYDRALSADEAGKIAKRSFSIGKTGDVSSRIEERVPVKPLGVKHFPFDLNASDYGNAIQPVAEIYTVYEDGGVWIGDNATNVITNVDWSNWTAQNISNIDYEEIGPNDIRSKVINFTMGTGGMYLYSYGDYAPQSPSTTYTVSVWVKSTHTIELRAYTADNVEVGRQYTESRRVHPGGWQRVIFTPFTTPADTQSASLSFNFTTYVTGARVSMCAPQMEPTAYPSPYVIGSRPAGDIHLPYNIVDLSNQFTIYGWWKPYTVMDGSYNPPITFNRRSSNYTYQRILIMESSTTSSTQLRAWMPDTASTEKYIYSGGFIELDKWNFFALRRQSMDITLFHGVSGNLNSSTLTGGGSGLDYMWPLVDSNWGWLIGEYNNANGNGYYKDYHFIQSPLSDAEISSIYKTGMRAYKNNRLITQGHIREGKVL